MAFAATRWPPPGPGVTLVELIVCVGILGLVLTCILQLVPFSHIANRKAWNTNAAVDIARTQMETVRSMAVASFDTLPALLGPTTQTIEKTDYTWTVTISPYHGSTTLKLVTADVRWNQHGGMQDRVFQTLVTRTDPPPATPAPSPVVP